MFRFAGKQIGYAALVVGCLLTGVNASVAADSELANTSSSSNNDMAALRGFDPTVLQSALDTHPDTSDLMLGAGYYLSGSTEFGFGVAAGTSGQTICQMRTDCSWADTFPVPPNQSVSGAAAMPGSPDPSAQTGSSGYYYLSYTEDGDDGAGGVLFKQGLRNDTLSYAVDPEQDCRTVTSAAGQARCNQLDFGFHQEVALTGPGSGAGAHGDGDQVFDLFFSVDALVDANGNLLGEAKGSFTESYDDVTAGTPTSNSCSGTFSYSTAGGYTQLTGPAGECP